MEEKLAALRDECRREVVDARWPDLSLRSRRRLLLALGPPLPPREALAGPQSTGHRRRAQLALQVIERVLPIWTRHHGGDPGDVGPLVEQARRSVVEVDGDRSELLRDGRLLAHHASCGGPGGKRGIDYLHAAMAIGEGAMVIARDDQLLVPGEGVTQEMLDDPEDPDFFDQAYWAAAAEAGASDLDGFSPDWEAKRQFWLWWLDEALLAV